MFPMLLYMDSLSTVRLHRSTLYDVLSSSNGTGVASVNAYTFQIACGYVTDVTSRNFVWNETLQAWSVTTDGSNYTLIPLSASFRWAKISHINTSVPLLQRKASSPCCACNSPHSLVVWWKLNILFWTCRMDRGRGRGILQYSTDP
jgi:hypothetical protein